MNTIMREVERFSEGGGRADSSRATEERTESICPNYCPAVIFPTMMIFHTISLESPSFQRVRARMQGDE
jgi:hypothetical protein